MSTDCKVSDEGVESALKDFASPHSSPLNACGKGFIRKQTIFLKTAQIPLIIKSGGIFSRIQVKQNKCSHIFSGFRQKTMQVNPFGHSIRSLQNIHVFQRDYHRKISMNQISTSCIAN